MVANDYEYDDLDRLTDVEYLGNPSDVEVFPMDDLGNRTGQVTQRDGTHTYSVDSLTNRYTQIDAAPIEHDAAGNMTGDKDGYTYFYDYENRIVKIEDDSSSTVATFEYDALGRRIRKVDAVVFTTTLYYYDPDWRCLEERDGSDSLQRSFIYGNYIDEVLVMTVPGSPAADYYYLHDHLYSPAALLAANGAVVERYEYDAYGTVHVMDASYGSRSASSYGNPYTFTGRRLDELDNAGLKSMYYRHRYYDSFAGRFLQNDPSGYSDGLNLYTALRSNAIGYADPMGLSAHQGIHLYLPGKGRFSGHVSTHQHSSTLRSETGIRFKPDKGLSCCSRIAFVQIAKTIMIIDWGIDTYENWALDGGIPYANGTPWVDGGYMPYAEMDDAPGFYGGWQNRVALLTQDFETCAICMAGQERGSYYGCLTWGHDFTRATNPTTGQRDYAIVRYIDTVVATGWHSGTSVKAIISAKPGIAGNAPSQIFRRIVDSRLP